MRRASKVDDYIAGASDWKECLILLRQILLSTGLEETVKWGMPVYTLNNKNVAGFSSFKSWTGIWFYQGVFLKDPAGVLINAQEGTTKALRQWRFTSAREIQDRKDTILAYLKEAIHNQEQGKEIRPERNKTVLIPEELELAFSRDPALKDSFDALSPYRKREYAEHVASAKREETRQKRLEQIIPMILDGIGLSDKYRKQD